MTISIRRTVLTAGAVVLLGLAAIGLVQAASSAGPAPVTPLAHAPVAAAPATMTTAGLTPEADAVIASQLDAILAADQTTAAQPAGGRDKVGPGQPRRGGRCRCRGQDGQGGLGGQVRKRLQRGGKELPQQRSESVGVALAGPHQVLVRSGEHADRLAQL